MNPLFIVVSSISVLALVALIVVIFSGASKDSVAIEQIEIVTTRPTETKTDKVIGTPFVEIQNPAGFVNSNDQPFKIADYVGKQVILLDVMTYSCINCQRTFPYVNSWYETYKDEGLIVIGIHTPEFAYEKNKSNVEKAFAEFSIKFPTVLDNDYGTWRALGNRFWPRMYLIDIHGNMVYDHIGEGAYDETEAKIQELLKERTKVLNQAAS